MFSMTALLSNSPIEYHIDKLINVCITYIDKQSTFETLSDSLIASLLRDHHIEKQSTRILFKNLFDDFTCKYYGNNYQYDHIDDYEQELTELSRLMMDGYNTYYFSDHVDLCFRAFISRAFVTQVMKYMYK